jgi:hypothetical protein
MAPQLVNGFNGDALAVEFELVRLRMSEEVRRQIELPNQFKLGQLVAPFCGAKTNVVRLSLRRRICAILRSHQQLYAMSVG